MRVEPVFASAPSEAGIYESFYLRAVSPHEPLGVWIRHTVRKEPGQAPTGSVWCTVFDASERAPAMHKASFEEVRVPPGGWIEIGGRTAMGPAGAQGECGPARWSLGVQALAPELRHLRPALLYRTPLPRTKLTSPAPLARFDGVLELEGRPPIELSGWHGMVGHNWGTEHAARWIWMHGCDFPGAPGAWLDLAAGRVQVGSRLTPWIVNGALSFDGATRRLAGRPVVTEDPWSAQLELRGAGGLSVRASVTVPPASVAGWRYADPGVAGPAGAGPAGEHDVANCSIAGLELAISRRGEGGRLVLRSAHGGAYELGMRERDHGVPLAPFADG